MHSNLPMTEINTLLNYRQIQFRPNLRSVYIFQVKREIARNSSGKETHNFQQKIFKYEMLPKQRFSGSRD